MSFYPRQPVADADYLLRRAEAEATLAETAQVKEAEEAHHALASLYLERLFGRAVAPSEDETPQDPQPALLLALRSALTREPPSLRGAPIADLVLELQEL